MDHGTIGPCPWEGDGQQHHKDIVSVVLSSEDETGGHVVCSCGAAGPHAEDGVSAIAAWNNWVGAVRQAIQKDIEGAHFVIAALALQAGGSIELPPGILAKIEKRGRLATNNRIGGGFTITYIPPTEAGGAE